MNFRYLLTPNFLFKTPLSTSIRFVKIESPVQGAVYPNLVIDANKRISIISYLDGMKYSDLSSINKFSYLSENLIEDFTQELSTHDCVVNGIRYYFNYCAEFFTCLLFDGNKTEVPNGLFCSNQSVTMFLNSVIISKWNLNDYLNYINKSIYLKAEKDGSFINFKITNFRTLDLKFKNHCIFESTYADSTDLSYINSSDIVCGLVDTVKSKLPDYIIQTNISDLFSQKQKKKLLFYKASLPIIGENSSRIMSIAPYGLMRQVDINIDWEFITDDFEQYNGFRDIMLFNTELFRIGKFSISDKDNNNWSYTVIWNTDLPQEIDRSPSIQLLDETALFSVKFSCNVFGWLVNSFDDKLDTIIYPITRFYVDKWKFVTALFDKTDPNVNTGYVLAFDNGYKIILTQSPEPPLGDMKLFLLSPDDEIIFNNNLPYMRFTNQYDNDYVDIITSEPINPLDLSHGELYHIDFGIRQIFTCQFTADYHKSSNEYKKILNLKSIISNH